MTDSYTEFFDIIGANFDQVPLVAGTVRAVYVTGSGPVPESAAQLAAAKAAGVGLITIDQTPGLVLFRQGKARFGDIEYLAGTDASASSAVAERQALGLTEHGLYASLSVLPGLKAGIANPAGVEYWVADWALSAAAAQARLAVYSDEKAIQFGDPASNPLTLVPGTSMNLRQANADIDIASCAWLAQFLPGGGPLPPAPPAPVPNAAPVWPFGPRDYLGTPSPDPYCHSGFFSSVDNHVVALWQQRMKFRGWTIAVDGKYGLQSKGVCEAFQREKSLHVDGDVGPITWGAAWTAPIT